MDISNNLFQALLKQQGLIDLEEFPSKRKETESFSMDISRMNAFMSVTKN